MATTTDVSELARLRLLQLVSPALPIGAFAYSQGLEWAVEAGWLKDSESLSDWLGGLLREGVARVDIPLLGRLYSACESSDEAMVRRWSRWLLASRETAELRAEEANRGRALAALLNGLAVPRAEAWNETLALCQAAGFALAAVHWKIPLREAALGYAWSWLENEVTAAVKIIPLGQTDGQRVLHALAGSLPAVLTEGLALPDQELGGSCLAQAIASSRHETQYSRLFRS